MGAPGEVPPGAPVAFLSNQTAAQRCIEVADWLIPSGGRGDHDSTSRARDDDDGFPVHPSRVPLPSDSPWALIGPDQINESLNFSLSLASWCAGSAIKRPRESVPAPHTPATHGLVANRRVHRCV